MSVEYSLVLLLVLCTVTLVQGNLWPECGAGDIRLYNVSQKNPQQGRVHVCSLQRIWRRVCNYSNTFGQEEMNVTCRQLGFLPYGTPGIPADNNDTSDGFLLTNVTCRGDEQRLADCNYTASTSCISTPVVRCYEAFPPREVIAECSQTSTLLSWREPEGNNLVNESVTEYIAECSALESAHHHSVSHTVNNLTTNTTVNGLYSNTTYNCCVTAMFETYSTKSCTITQTMMTTLSTTTWELSSASSSSGVLILWSTSSTTTTLEPVNTASSSGASIPIVTIIAPTVLFVITVLVGVSAGLICCYRRKRTHRQPPNQTSVYEEIPEMTEAHPTSRVTEQTQVASTEEVEMKSCEAYGHVACV